MIEKVHKKNRVSGKMKYEKICVYCTKEVEYFHGKKPSICPHCGASDYTKPPTETKLFILQDLYLKNRDNKHLTEMFVILKSYAVSLIKRVLPKDFIYHYDQVEEKAQDAATAFIEYYLVHEDFKVEKSFGGYLQWKVKEVLWNKKLQREEDHESLNFSSHKVNYDQPVDRTVFASMKPLYGTIEDHTQAAIASVTSSDDLILGIETIISTSLNEVKTKLSLHQTLLVLLGVCLTMEGKTDVYMDKFYHYFGSKIKKYVDITKLLIYRFIKERD